MGQLRSTFLSTESLGHETRKQRGKEKAALCPCGWEKASRPAGLALLAWLSSFRPLSSVYCGSRPISTYPQPSDLPWPATGKGLHASNGGHSQPEANRCHRDPFHDYHSHDRRGYNPSRSHKRRPTVAITVLAVCRTSRPLHHPPSPHGCFSSNVFFLLLHALYRHLRHYHALTPQYPTNSSWNQWQHTHAGSLNMLLSRLPHNSVISYQTYISNWQQDTDAITETPTYLVVRIYYC